MAAFATVEQLVAQWRPLKATEKVRAEKLLDMAAVLIRRHVTVVPGSEDESTARQVSLEMVRAALLPGVHEGKSSYSDTAGDVVESATLLNPAATLRFTRDQKDLFGVGTASAPQWFFGDC
ncbi:MULTISPECIES: hypothetical protein [Tomitella]|uniref:Head-to-tail adaptor n=1 Tax=Tomitella cavernea TaxID=1387982 RepID=A0ABP9CFD9_9ACTN|nr:MULTISPECIES: hypothetical protein [Tomitella]